MFKFIFWTLCFNASSLAPHSTILQPTYWLVNSCSESANRLVTFLSQVSPFQPSFCKKRHYFFITSHSRCIKTRNRVAVGKSPVHFVFLLEWDESGRVGRSDAGSAVSNWLVRHREFGQVVADHFWLDFDLVEHYNFQMLVLDVLIGSGLHKPVRQPVYKKLVFCLEIWTG